jgi:hypothetical protein
MEIRELTIKIIERLRPDILEKGDGYSKIGYSDEVRRKYIGEIEELLWHELDRFLRD